jgi:hypothetical protein
MPRRTVSQEFLFTDHWIRKPARDKNKTEGTINHK